MKIKYRVFLILSVVFLNGCSSLQIYNMHEFFGAPGDPAYDRVDARIQSLITLYMPMKQPNEQYFFNGRYVMVRVPYRKEKRIASSFPIMICEPTADAHPHCGELVDIDSSNAIPLREEE